MPLKIALVQVSDVEKICDLNYVHSGLGGKNGGVPLMERQQFIDLYKKSGDAYYPLGVLCLAAYARKKFRNKIEIIIIDMLLDRIGVDELMDRLDDFGPDVVGLSSFSMFAGALHDAASRIKSKDSNCVVLAGGPYCSSSTMRVTSDNNIDCVGYGEGEETFNEMIDRLLKKKDLKGLLGTAHLENGKVRVNPPRPLIEDLDTLPFPAVDLVDVPKYWRFLTPLYYQSPWMVLFNSRGCPYRCVYCHNIFGKKTRFMSIKRTHDEMAYYQKQYGIREFVVFDDIFNLDVDRGIGLCDKLVKGKKNFRFYFYGGLRADIMKKELLEAMIRAGTCYICYAVESGSPRVQKYIRKYLNLEKAAKAINFTADAGVWVNTYNMLGFPNETLEEMMMTINFNLEQRHHSMSLFKVIPQEGTRLYDMVEEQRKHEGETGMYFEFNEISDVDGKVIDFKKLIDDAKKSFFFDSKRIDRIVNMKSPVMTGPEIYHAYGTLFLLNAQAMGVTDVSQIPKEILPPMAKILKEGGLLTK